MARWRRRALARRTHEFVPRISRVCSFICSPTRARKPVSYGTRARLAYTHTRTRIHRVYTRVSICQHKRLWYKLHIAPGTGKPHDNCDACAYTTSTQVAALFNYHTTLGWCVCVMVFVAIREEWRLSSHRHQHNHTCAAPLRPALKTHAARVHPRSIMVKLPYTRMCCWIYNTQYAVRTRATRQRCDAKRHYYMWCR